VRLGRRALTLAIVTVAAIAATATRARAQTTAPPQLDSPRVQLPDSALETRVREIAAGLRCPVCQGESILDSPAELAQQMRSVVRDQLRAGRTPDEIKAYFVGRYGEWILLEPAMTGLNIALYAFPVLLVIGGLALVVVVVKRWTRPMPTAPDDAPVSPIIRPHGTDRDDSGSPSVL
jgi:cytochrome c-type biogenesis protein CcmH